VDKPFEEALKNLLKANVSGIVFDVRNNPGGTMQSLVNILDLLLPEGRIISEKNKSGDMKEYTSDANEVKLPMAVLINEYSISAAEFFAASLQEYGKATIVGTPTTGKGSAQKPIALEGGGGLILSTSKYYTAKGVSLAETGGIKPDTEVPLTQDEIKRFYKLTETEDRQLQAAIGAIKNKTGSLKPQ
jgi:carboxyl-terminal processing protease